MSNGEKRGGLWIDPRTKILLLLLCVLSATMAPSLLYEMLIVALVACFGIVCGKVRYSIIGVIVYGGFYLLTQAVLQMPSGNVQVLVIAFLGLVHKVYPCGILSGIIISTTKTSFVDIYFLPSWFFFRRKRQKKQRQTILFSEFDFYLWPTFLALSK